MTPQHLDAIAGSVDAVQRRADAFSARFYERLFELAPDVRSMFPPDLHEQRGKLVSELLFLADAATDLPRLTERARELGERHHRYGVRPDHYAVVLQALLDALQHALGSRFDADVATAWRRLYWLIAETMLEGTAGDVFADQH